MESFDNGRVYSLSTWSSCTNDINFWSQKMNTYIFSSKSSDDGLKASYNVSLLIANAGKPQTIGEEWILPAIKEVIKTQISWTSHKIDTSQWRFSSTKSGQNVEETLIQVLLTTDSVCNWINPLFQETNRYLWHMYASLRIGHCVKKYRLNVSGKQIPMVIQFIKQWRTI